MRHRHHRRCEHPHTGTLQLTKANEAGTTALRAQGTLLELHGFVLRESAGVARHTAGTGASYVTNGR